MLEWYAKLTLQEQSMFQGMVVMALMALVRAIAHWTKRPLSESTLAKLGNYVVVALATAGTTAIAEGGFGSGFVVAWMTALWTAVGAWEGLSKLWKPTKEGLDTVGWAVASGVDETKKKA